MPTKFTGFLQKYALDNNQQLHFGWALLIYSTALTFLSIPIQLREIDESLSRILASLIFLIPINSLSLLPFLAIERFLFPIFVGWRYPTARRLVGLPLYLISLSLFNQNAESRALFSTLETVYQYNAYMILLPFLSYFIVAYWAEDTNQIYPNDILDDI